jgi:NitT/TauT family transport system permease protein
VAHPVQCDCGRERYSTVGLGAQISAATDSGNFGTLLLATIVIATLVCMNRLVWRRLYRLAETKYRLDL